MAFVLKGLLENPKADPNQLAKPFGYKAPFTQKYKSWLQKTGILEDIRNVEISSFGQVIVKNDPNLHSIITQWFMHHQLTSESQEAESWFFFVKEFLPSVISFSKTELAEKLGMKLMPHSVKHFSTGRPMNKVITKKLIDCYTLNEGLGALNIIYFDTDGNIVKGKPEILGPWKRSVDLQAAFDN